MTRAERRQKLRQEVLAPVERWTAGKKSELIQAVLLDVVTKTEALRIHRITSAEFEDWVARYRKHPSHLRVRATQVGRPA
jgi:hypothetical protein